MIISEPADVRSDAPSLDVSLQPHDSLGERGFAIVMVSLLGGASAAGVVLALSGFAVVALFLLADVALLALAFRVFRRSQRRCERIVIECGSVLISRYRAARLVDQRRLAVVGLALEREDDPDFGCQRLSFVLRGRRYDIARDLAPAERDAIASRLADALADAGGASTVRRIHLPSLLTGEPSFAR